MIIIINTIFQHHTLVSTVAIFNYRLSTSRDNCGASGWRVAGDNGGERLSAAFYHLYAYFTTPP